MKPAAVPPSQTRWSKTNDICAILRTAELAVDDPRPVDDPAEAEDRDLRVVDDRGAAVDAEAAVVVQRERARGELVLRGPALARGVGEPADLGVELARGQQVRVRTAGTSSPRSVCAASPRLMPVVLDELVALGVDLAVELRVLLAGRPPRSGRGRPAGPGPACPSPYAACAQREQRGGVDVDPDGRLGDLRAAAGQCGRDRLAEPTHRDAPRDVEPVRCRGSSSRSATACGVRRAAIAALDITPGDQPVDAGPVDAEVDAARRAPAAAPAATMTRGHRRRRAACARCGPGAGCGARPAAATAACAVRRAVADQDVAGPGPLLLAVRSPRPRPDRAASTEISGLADGDRATLAPCSSLTRPAYGEGPRRSTWRSRPRRPAGRRRPRRRPRPASARSRPRSALRRGRAAGTSDVVTTSSHWRSSTASRMRSTLGQVEVLQLRRRVRDVEPGDPADRRGQVSGSSAR